jgi:DNA polymerase IV
MPSGTILHVNAVGLMAALEEGLDGSLRGRPFVVANMDAPRSVVLDLSPRAHREGLRRGMVLSLARNLCRDVEVRAPRPELYGAAEERLWRLGLEYTPVVERAGRGHLFIDLRGTSRLFGAPEDAAQRLRKAIREETGLSPSLALSTSKTVSKVATRVFRPAGFVALSHNEEAGLLRMQPVGLLPGVGPALLGRFGLLDIDEIGDLADLSECEARAVGPRGPELVARARGRDDSPVDPEPPERRAVSGETVFEPDTVDPEVLRLRLEALVAELGFALRREGRGARRASVELGYTDGARGCGASRSARVLARDDELASLARSALEAARGRRVRIRRVALRLSEIESAGPELDLFEPADAKRSKLQTALDGIHGRFGFEAIEPCAALAAKG